MSLGRRGRFVPPPQWTPEQLEADRLAAEDIFRTERMEEPLEEYLTHFETVQGVLENLIEATVDLEQLDEQAVTVLSDAELLDGVRYLTGPPISMDDLKTLVESRSLTPQALAADPELVSRLLQVIRAGLDRRRFPWVNEGREPSAAEREAAILASAALMATRRTETARRTSGKKLQEERVRESLLTQGFVETGTKAIGTIAEAPQPGQFCREVVLGERKADLVVGLWDRRIMAIECKVSNSSTNSVKRLNNDAAVKAEVWIKDFGHRQVVPVALLSGVYKLHNLEQAQSRGLTLYWAHRLSDLTEWVEQTRS
jgi:hypothetical protein